MSSSSWSSISADGGGEGEGEEVGELADALRAKIEEEMGKFCSLLNFDAVELGDAGALIVAEKLRGNTIVEILRLVHCSIGAVGTRALAESLAEDNITVKALCLVKTIALGDVGSQAMALMLKKNTSLEYLSIYNCRVTDQGAAALGTVLKENCTLKTLLLGSNFIGNDGAEALADGLRQNESLEMLSLCFCQLTDAGAASLLAALRESNSTLTMLDLYDGEFYDYEADDEFDIKIIESIESMLEENKAVVPASAERRARCLLFCCLQLAPTAHEHEVPSIGAVPVPVMRYAVEHAGNLHVARRFEIASAAVGQSSAGVRNRSSSSSSDSDLLQSATSRRR